MSNVYLLIDFSSNTENIMHHNGRVDRKFLGIEVKYIIVINKTIVETSYNFIPSGISSRCLRYCSFDKHYQLSTTNAAKELLTKIKQHYQVGE